MKTLHLVATNHKMTRPLFGSLVGWLLAAWRTLSVGVVRSQQSRQMHLVETLPLGGKRQLMLVRCGGERYLIGAGQESVQSILRVGRAHDRRGQPGGSQDHAQGFGEQT